MESVWRALFIYFFLLVLFRLAGKRTLAQASSFELVLLLIISETTTEALVDDDHSVTNAVILITTLIGTSIVLSVVKHRWKAASRWLEGLPFAVVRDGRELREPMDKARVDHDEIVAAGRQCEGLEGFHEIKHAVLENDGKISVVRK